MTVKVTTAQALRWRDWLVTNIPDDVLGDAKAELESTEDIRGFVLGTKYSPLNFFLWNDLNTITNASVRVREYLNAWYGDWREVYKEVTKDVQ